IDLHDFYNPSTKEHLYVTRYDQSMRREGYEWRGVVGKIFVQATPGTIALSGQQGRIGYIFAQPHANTTGLYHCVSGDGDLFTSSASTARKAASQPFTRCDGVVGYVGF
ncbi:MAG: hypothetical protein QOH90_1697, partial [Actinomycetota bacterium]|nr:hypothetical protein [Actinomycetota bacterium]